eukprot:1398340-Karenia_brevis.AAC.1
MFAGAFDVASYTIRSLSHLPLKILHMPSQHFKPFLTRFAFDAVHASYHSTRTVLQDLPSFDPHIMLDALPRDDLHFVNVVKSIASLSSVDQSTLRKFNDSITDTCVFCQRCPSSMHHICWECTHPSLVEARRPLTPQQQHVLDGIDGTPLAMRYGLTPPLSILPSTPWWTNDNEQFERLELNSTCKAFHGIDPQYSSDTMMCQWLQPYARYDATTAFLLLNGAANDLDDPPTPPHIHQHPPDTPNVFTDGSLSNPTQPTFGLASAGIWHPGRTATTMPLTELEQDFATHHFTHDGLESFLYLGGLPSSSTRAELVGLLGAVLIPGAIHIALDNQAVVNISNDIISSIASQTAHRMQNGYHKH